MSALSTRDALAKALHDNGVPPVDAEELADDLIASGAVTTGAELADENARLRAELAVARGERPSGFWSQREWEDWSNDLATLIPEDDASRFSNPEGAQEGIIKDCLRAYVAVLAGIGRL